MDGTDVFHIIFIFNGEHNMIPKIIHYCWFGRNPLPKCAKKCIESWKRYCPDYEIKEWNEDNFDIHSCKYVEQAYRNKKWAFVSDYARFWILYNYGGVYFDTDVELIKPIDIIIENGSFMGYEAYCDIEFLNPKHEHLINPGLGIGAEKGNILYKEILDYYDVQSFTKEDGSVNFSTVVEIVSNLLAKKGHKLDGKLSTIDDIIIYPQEYFCPLNYANGKTNITSRTISIHHYETSWQSGMDKFKMSIKRKLPSQLVSTILKLKSRIRDK